MRKIIQAGFAAYDRGDYKTAFKEWLPLAEQGDAEAQYNLGGMCEQGKGVTLDYAKAVKWYLMSAKQGDAKAQKNLGWMYGQSMGVRQDYVRAYMWNYIANENGLKEVKISLDFLEAGMTPADISKAQTMARECLESDYKNCGD